MLNLEYVILGMLAAEISMVAWIFVWAHRAIGEYKDAVMSLLSGETDESSAIIDKLARTLYQKLYRYFNLQIPQNPDSEPTNPLQIPENVSDIAAKYMGSAPASNPLLAEAASKMGIPADAVKYLPLIQSFLAKKGPSQNINTHDDSW